MKKFTRVLAMMLVLMCSLVGCGGENEVNETSISNQEVGGMSVVNPIKQVSYEELVKVTGIPLYIPEEATEVVYSTIAPEPPVAQATFTLDGKDVCLRAVATNELEAQDISGLYYQWEITEVIDVGYCTGTVYLKGDMGYVAWLDIAPGINYNLSLKSGATKEALVELANAVFTEVQGDAE